MKRRNIPFTVILLLLSCFVFSPQAKAVNPPPDGGYPGGNTAEGQNALLSLTTGGYNTAVGYFSLRVNTANSFNTAIGAGTLLLNVADENTATGAGALLSNTAGNSNTANGAFALFSNTEGVYNTAIGDQALFSNATGIVNTAVGAGALANNTTGDRNTAIGGDYVLFSNTTGTRNTAVGVNALQNNTTGGFNTAVGNGALSNNTTGGGNFALGAFAGSNVTTANNVICIGVAGNNVDNSCFIGNIFGATSSDGVSVFVNSNGRLGTITSSRRFKEEIRPMEQASEALFALKPVTFRYKKELDTAGTSQFGLVAEDVENVNPDLVVRDKQGKPYSVRYDQVNAMLLNEFLKEHKAVQQQQREINALRAELKEQRLLIQKVNHKIELSSHSPQIVSIKP